MLKNVKFLSVLGLFLLVQLGYAEMKTAVVAGGCFWCVQADFDKLKGVIKTEVGYDGGTTLYPNYKHVSQGKTDHLEAVKIWYENDVLEYIQLLHYFFRHIDPTVKGRQFCDLGEQYQSAILYENDGQKAAAQAVLDNMKNYLNKPIYTQLRPSTTFTPAEEYHQKYYLKNPVSYAFYRWQCGRDARLKEVWQ
ncbi:peptide-methionine (S)-S-oxide reductase MsrA [Cysteiniphilum sp. QT6929]|uniref:peptide-methionine (S)-S-oxide reductase MsrA n=1 Tax=Cysteiniphilum sp. QT6929 TaxID=2975055 RepID=UPI0024B36226|nr:peptide-methionine (S)-S-oxide reductase MsrA [Cysteiniphilum sp. QT6929]WHN66238.1 peptide-methionine (S)-S-oxide reductase MsrA [Cysteiniphilum sp. QT6929]